MIYIGQQKHSSRWRAVAVPVLLTTAIALVVPGPSARAAAAAPPPTKPPTALATAQALVAAFGPGATVDDSSATQCMSAPAIPLAYRTDRIILRPSPAMTTSAAVDRLTAALQAEMGPGAFRVGVPETITWDADADPAARGSASGARTASARTASGRSATDDQPIWRVVSVPVRSEHEEHEEDVPIIRVARRLRMEGLPAAPDYLMGSHNGPLGVWPEGGPQPAKAPGVPRPGLGADTTVVVYDTGVPDASVANLPANLTRPSGNDVEQPDRDGDGLADLYYSVHLTAIAGIFATLVPDATVLGVRITGSNGVATDFSAAKRMANTLRDANDNGVWPQVIVNAFSSPVCGVGAADPAADMVPLGLQMVAEAVDRHEEAVVVASAGNSGTSRPHYPAAFHTTIPSIVSVGALDATADGGPDPWTAASRSAPPASFTNYGSWVTAWAPGMSLPTYHAIGLRFEAKGPEIDGFATVKGTSFAAPYVGALILEQLALSGQTPQQAWEAVRAAGRTCAAAVGGGTAVALTGMQATATTAADPTLLTQC